MPARVAIAFDTNKKVDKSLRKMNRMRGRKKFAPTEAGGSHLRGSVLADEGNRKRLATPRLSNTPAKNRIEDGSGTPVVVPE